MSLINDQLRVSLPPLNSQEAEEEVFIYARLFLPGTSLNWYVFGGGDTDHAGFVFACMFMGTEECSFGDFPESFLEQLRGSNGEKVELDTAFQQGRLTDVVLRQTFSGRGDEVRSAVPRIETKYFLVSFFACSTRSCAWE